MGYEPVVSAAVSVGAAILLNASVSKGVSPSRLAAAMAELVPSIRILHRPGISRGLAIEEAVTVVLLVWSPRSVVVPGLVLVLGGFFLAAGIGGRLRGSREPCGCFGALREAPMGWANAGMGIGFIGLGILILTTSAPVQDPGMRAAVCAVALIGLALAGAHLQVRKAIGHFATASVKIGETT